MEQPNIPEEYQPIGVWKYVGWDIAFAIPLVGLIIAIIYSFGKPKNINLRNYARAKLSLWCIVFIFYFVLAFILAFAGVELTEYLN